MGNGQNPFVALLTVFSICYILEKENDLTNPLYVFGTLGSTVTLHLCLIDQGDLIGGWPETEIPVLILSVLSLAFTVWKNKSSLKENIFKKLQFALFAAGALFSAIYSAVLMTTKEANTLTKMFNSASVFSFSLCIFALSVVFIIQGLKENRLYPLNLGFVSIAALAIMLLTELEMDMLIKGCVLLMMGGVLIFMNLKITRSREKNKKALADTGGKND